LVRPADPDALADAIVRMINDYEFRKGAAERGRQKIEIEFDVDKEADKLRTYFVESYNR
jgi:glycosyltransferase involved in cell wall biosynthesis